MNRSKRTNLKNIKYISDHYNFKKKVKRNYIPRFLNEGSIRSNYDDWFMRITSKGYGSNPPFGVVWNKIIQLCEKDLKKKFILKRRI